MQSVTYIRSFIPPPWRSLLGGVKTEYDLFALGKETLALFAQYWKARGDFSRALKLEGMYMRTFSFPVAPPFRTSPWVMFTIGNKIVYYPHVRNGDSEWRVGTLTRVEENVVVLQVPRVNGGEPFRVLFHAPTWIPMEGISALAEEPPRFDRWVKLALADWGSEIPNYKETLQAFLLRKPKEDNN